MKSLSLRSVLTLVLLASLGRHSLAHAQDAAASPTPTPTEKAAPAMDPAPADPALRPVLAQFGGEAGLKALMDDFMIGLLADQRTAPFFETVDQQSVKNHLAEQFCVILGGDCHYSGRDMRTTHAQMGLTRADFDALVEILQIAMDKRGIPFRAQNKLLAKLAPMHRDIETR